MSDAPATSAPAATSPNPPSGAGSGGAPSQDAAPSAVARAKPASEKKLADKQSARTPQALDQKVREGMAKRREERAGLRLVQPDGQTTIEGEGETQADDTQAETTTPEKQVDERAHWTQKAKADLDAANAKVTDYQAREQQWQAASLQAQHQREDIEADRDYYKSLYDGALAAIRKLGHEVDPVELKNRELERDMARLQRQQKRGEAQHQEAQTAHQKAAAVAQVKPRIESLFAKYPALNSPEGHKYLKAHVTAGALDTPTGLEDAAAAFVLARRTAKAVEQQKQNPATQAQRPAPTAQQNAQRSEPPAATMTLSGHGGGAQSRRPVSERPTPRQTDKKILEHFAKKRASR